MGIRELLEDPDRYLRWVYREVLGDDEKMSISEDEFVEKLQKPCQGKIIK